MVGKVAGLLVALAALLVAYGAEAHKVKTTTLEIMHPWVHAADAGAASTSGYLVIHNTGTQTERLLGAVIDGVGEAVIVQTAAGQLDGSCRLGKGLEIAPGATLELKPGVAGLQFGMVSKDLMEAIYANGVLNFAKAGAVKVEFFIEATDAKASAHATLPECPLPTATQ
jgi:periplasmic copper chaperone A